MPPKDTLGNRVRIARERLGITQIDLAREVGISRQALISVEKGRMNPSVVVALKIARIVREPVDYVFYIADRVADSEPAPAASPRAAAPVAAVAVPEPAPAPEPEPEPEPEPVASPALPAAPVIDDTVPPAAPAPEPVYEPEPEVASEWDDAVMPEPAPFAEDDPWDEPEAVEETGETEVEPVCVAEEAASPSEMPPVETEDDAPERAPHVMPVSAEPALPSPNDAEHAAAADGEAADAGDDAQLSLFD